MKFVPSQIAEKAMNSTIAVSPILAGGAIGALRQLGAEGSVLVENGEILDGQNLLTKAVIEAWRAVEANASPNLDKFPNGLESFKVSEELIEGAGMSALGLALAYLIDKAIISPAFHKLDPTDTKHTALKIATKGTLYAILGQASYEIVSQNLGPYLHEKLGVHDVDLSIKTVLEIINLIKEAI